MIHFPAGITKLQSQLFRALPYLLIGLGMWLMGGCFYLPVPEHASDNPKRLDFRPLLGGSDSDRPIRPGINKAQIAGMLGAAFRQNDHQMIYELSTERAAWVYPLCFTATPAQERCYALRLTYDEGGRLIRWEVARADELVSWLNGATTGNLPNEALKALDRPGAVSSDSKPAMIH